MLFSSSDKQKNNIPSFSDDAKNKEIREKLYHKRMELESKVSLATQEEYREYKVSLEELKSAMKTFGISEMDYQIYKESLQK